MTTETVLPAAEERWAGVKMFKYNEKRPRKEISWPLLLSISGLHLGALLAIVLHIMYLGMPSTKVFVTAGVMYFFCGLGITMGNHRFWTHGGFKAPRWLRIFLLVAAGLTLEGPVLQWVPDHWWHHIRSDMPGDMHSPKQYGGSIWRVLKGIGWGHSGWLWYFHHRPDAKDIAPEKLKWILTDPDVLMQKKFAWVFFIATFAIPFAICGWDGLLIAGFVRIVVFLNFTWSINSVCHLIGTTVAVKYKLRADSKAVRIKLEGDGSRNFALIAIPTFGESYHALHHLFDSVAYHGWGRYDIDVTKWILILLEKLHIISDVVHPPVDAVVKASDVFPDRQSFVYGGNPPTEEALAEARKGARTLLELAA